MMIGRLPIDRGLACDLGCPGPRDTSHPAAHRFREELREEQLRSWAWRSNMELSPRPISLYVHVPYCFRPCFYCGRSHGPSRDPARAERYAERILQELRLTAPLFDTRREVIQLHFAGGAANFLDPPQLSRMFTALARSFHFSPSVERDFSIELDPRHVGTADVAMLARLGFNRVSLEVHEFDDPVQHAINRVHGVAETVALIHACRRNGLRSVNIALIYGLPLQTLAGFGRTLSEVIAARPERVTIRGYAQTPADAGTVPQAAAALPGPEARLALLRLALERLGAGGYRHMGPDQFALPEDDLVRMTLNDHLDRNFLGYLTHARSDLIGLGPGALSHIGRSITQNHRGIPEWEAALAQSQLPVACGVELAEIELSRTDALEPPGAAVGA